MDETLKNQPNKMEMTQYFHTIPTSGPILQTLPCTGCERQYSRCVVHVDLYEERVMAWVAPTYCYNFGLCYIKECGVLSALLICSYHLVGVNSLMCM